MVAGTDRLTWERTVAHTVFADFVEATLQSIYLKAFANETNFGKKDISSAMTALILLTILGIVWIIKASNCGVECCRVPVQAAVLNRLCVWFNRWCIWSRRIMTRRVTWRLRLLAGAWSLRLHRVRLGFTIDWLQCTVNYFVAENALVLVLDCWGGCPQKLPWLDRGSREGDETVK